VQPMAFGPLWVWWGGKLVWPMESGGSRGLPNGIQDNCICCPVLGIYKALGVLSISVSNVEKTWFLDLDLEKILKSEKFCCEFDETNG